MIEHKYIGPDSKLSKILAEPPFLFSYFFTQKLFRKGDIKVDSVRVKKDLIVSSGQIICAYADVKKFEPEIIYRDENITVFNKPFGISSENFASFVSLLYPNLILCHRLDTNTIGLLIFASSDAVFERIKYLFSMHKIEKHYFAEVYGVVPDNMILEDFLVKKEKENRVYIYSVYQNNSVPIKTIVTVLSHTAETSLLDVELVTGKTHQIRAHLAYHRYPLLGDGKYGDEQINRKFRTHYQHLQAYKLIFHTADDALFAGIDGLCVEIPKANF